MASPWQRVCAARETLIQAPVSQQVIYKGVPAAGLLAQVVVAKFSDHLPRYRQEMVFRPLRARRRPDGLASGHVPSARSAVLRPESAASSPTVPAGTPATFLGSGKENRCATILPATRPASKGDMSETGCIVHACRKFFDLRVANQRRATEQALQYIGQLY